MCGSARGLIPAVRARFGISPAAISSSSVASLLRCGGHRFTGALNHGNICSGSGHDGRGESLTLN
jgi:hypothetical protein